MSDHGRIHRAGRADGDKDAELQSATSPVQGKGILNSNLAKEKREKQMKKFIGLALAVAALAVVLPTSAVFATHGGTGNGAPNGAHYNLNLIGVSDKSADMTGNNGHRIFVKLWGKSKIMLAEGEDFKVLDANGTDGNGAKFQLPNPDPDGDGMTVYSVFARALGTPGGKSITSTCATGPGLDGVLGTADDEPISSVTTLELERSKGKSSFENVSKELLYVYADIDGDGNLERMALFDDRLEGYFCDYDNHGLKLVQLRFYECETIVPDADNPEGGVTDDACFGGSH